MQDYCKLTFVYWIKRKNFIDINTQGYIGVTSNPKRRWNDHYRDAMSGKHCNNFLSSSIKKYHDDIIFQIVFVGNEETCYNYEKELRPFPSIGWNLMSGGPVGKITEEGRKKISESAKNRILTEQQKLTRRWKKYQKTTDPKITRKDYIALINKEVPPSKSSIWVFSLRGNEQYSSCLVAAEGNKDLAYYIYECCELKTHPDWIYLKDL